MNYTAELSIHKVETSAERSGWNTYVKAMPQLGVVLGEIEKLYNAPGLGQILCDASHRFDLAYTRWQTVRLLRSQEIIGSSPLASGFEGYFVGAYHDPLDIVIKEAALGQRVLDSDTRNHSFALSRRHALDTLLLGITSQNIAHISPLFQMFRDLKAQASVVAATIQEGLDRDLNRTFRSETGALVAGAPGMTYLHKDTHFAHSYALPKAAKTSAASGPSISDIPSYYRDGFVLISTIGMLGHPVFRRIEATRSLMGRISRNWNFYPPRGSAKRERLEQQILISLLTELQEHAPESVERYVGSLAE